MAMAASVSALGMSRHFQSPQTAMRGASTHSFSHSRSASSHLCASDLTPRKIGIRLQKRAALRTKCESGSSQDKPSFGYTRKDVLLIGAGVPIFGVALKYGLERFGLDSLRAGNIVQLTMVLGLTVGWIGTYIFRVSNKEMTYAKQLKDYEIKVMEKRYQELPEAELETLLAQVEEEKERIQNRKKRSNST